MEIRAATDAGAVRQAVTPRRNGLPNIAEARALDGVERHILIRRRQMAHQRDEAQVRDHGGQIIAPVQPQPVHAGIDHHVAGAAARRPPARHLLRRGKNRPRTGLQCLGHVLRPHAMQDRQADALLQQRLQCRRLAPVGHEEVAASRLRQPAQHLVRAQAVAVRLDRRATGGGAALARQPAPVGNERVAVQAQAQRSGVAVHRDADSAPRFPRRGGCRRGQNSRDPFGTGLSGAKSVTAPVASAKPSVSTSDMNLPIWRGGKLTTAATCRPGRSASA